MHTDSAPSAEERRLVRPNEDRFVAGVCAGLGRYFGVNPLVYRVALSGLVLLGGVGLLVYAVAWLLIPDEGRGDSIAEEAVRERRLRPGLAIGVGLVGVALLVCVLGSGEIVDLRYEWLVILLAGLAIVWWQLRDRERVTADGAADATADQHARSSGTPPGRPRFPIFLPTLGVVLAGAGVLGALEATDVMNVDWIVALAVGVALVGVAVTVGAFFGGVAWLAAVGVVLAAVLVAATSVDIPLKGPIGEHTERPGSVRDLEDSYPVSIGQLNLDLRGLTLPQGTTEIHASVGIGQLNVVVPDGVRIEVDAHMTAGEATVLGEHVDHLRGDTRRFADDSAGPDTPKLRVEADVGLGQLVVRRR